MHKDIRFTYTITVLLVILTAVPSMADLFLEPPKVEPIWDVDEYMLLSSLWEQVDDQWHEGNYEVCIRILREIIHIDKSQTEAYTNAAWLLESIDHTFEGFDMLVQNALANPKNCTANFELGMKYYFFGGYDEAVNKLETSVSYGCSTTVERMLGHAYERAGNRDKAIEMFACVLGQDLNDGAALSNLVRVLKRIPPAHDPTRLWHRPEP